MAKGPAAKRKQQRRKQHAAATAPAPSASTDPALAAPGEGDRSRRVLAIRAAVAGVAVLGVLGLALAVRGGDEGGAASSVAAVDDAKSAGLDVKEGHSAHVYPWVELEPDVQAELDGQLERARAAALAYPTVADAEAAGWVVSQAEAATGAHVVRFDRLDGTFDIDEPDMLLFEGSEPDDAVIAASYHVVSSSSTPPEGFVSENDHWHRHRGICWSPDGKLESVEIDDAECAARGGERRDDQGGDGWMLHAWVVPGYENPDGVFASLNPDLSEQRSS